MGRQQICRYIQRKGGIYCSVWEYMIQYYIFALQACTGECDADDQCAKGLVCFQRENGETIPGCTGSGSGDTWDYCYDPGCSCAIELSGDNDDAATDLQVGSEKDYHIQFDQLEHF